VIGVRRNVNQRDYDVYAGIDWAREAHEVCIVDGDGRERRQRSVKHKSKALNALAEELTQAAQGHPDRVAIAIEVPRGAVVELLLERGFHVYTINPKQLDRFRDRHTVSGAKDDRLDAFVLADSLRTDLELFRRLEVDEPLIIRLRDVSRLDKQLGRQKVRLANQLSEQLLRYFPQVLELAGADEPWLWGLLELAPIPAKARKLSRSRIDKLLKAYRIRKLGADEVRQVLRQEPLQVAPGTVEAAGEHVAMLLAHLHLVHGQRRQCEQRIKSLLTELHTESGEQNEHRDADIIQSFPGAGMRVTATMLSEATEPLKRRDYHVLRCRAGSAAVTRRSGKSRRALMRYSCNGRLRDAVFYMAGIAVIRDAHWNQRYKRMRERGLGHARALRGLSDRMLCVLVRMLQQRQFYDPSRLAPHPSEEASRLA